MCDKVDTVHFARRTASCPAGKGTPAWYGSKETMKAITEALLQQCRTALLQQSDERIAALLAQWFELMIGDEGMDEELDDLCLLLDYRVQSWGAHISYATYTSWWEVEGYLEPSEGTFFCADVASLRKLLLDMPIKRRTPPQGYTRVESKEQRRSHEQERAVQACQQGYLVVFPDTPQAVTDAFRRWCKEHAHPYIWIEPRGQQQATLRAQTKSVVAREASTVLARFREQLPQLSAPYIDYAQARSCQARLSWISRRQFALEGI